MRIPSEVKERVLGVCDEMAGEAIDLLAEMVRIPSENPGYKYDEKLYVERGYTRLYDEFVTRGGETKVNNYLEPILREFCDETHRPAKDPLRSNLVGIINPGSERSLALNAHVDTVPTGPHELWTETGGNPFHPVIRDGKMYGRGTTDDKGPAACIIKAAEAVRRAGYRLKGELQLHLTVGEETQEGQTLGPGWFLREHPEYRTDACIVAEGSAPPVRLGITTTGPGVSSVTVTVKGKPVHAAMRYRTIRTGYEGEEVGVNAIDKAFKIYQALYGLEQEWGLKTDVTGLSPAGVASIPIAIVHGSPQGVELPFILPDRCELQMGVWRYPRETLEEVQEEVNRAIDGVVQSDRWLRENPPAVDWWSDWPPFWIEKDHPLTKTVASAYESVLNEPARYMAWQTVTDARWYEEAGVPALLIGPGSYTVAHAYNECIQLDEISDAMKIYALAAMEWLGFESL